MRLNKYDRRTKYGRNMGMKITFWRQDKISVMESSIKGKKQMERTRASQAKEAEEEP